MDSLNQLKKIREDAIERLRQSDDYKLIGKLTEVITDLGGTLTTNLDPISDKPRPLKRSGETDSDKIMPAPTGDRPWRRMTGMDNPQPINDEIQTTPKSALDNVDLEAEIADEIAAELKTDMELDAGKARSDNEPPVTDTDASPDQEMVPTVSIFTSTRDRVANGKASNV